MSRKPGRALVFLSSECQQFKVLNHEDILQNPESCDCILCKRIWHMLYYVKDWKHVDTEVPKCLSSLWNCKLAEPPASACPQAIFLWIATDTHTQFGGCAHIFRCAESLKWAKSYVIQGFESLYDSIISVWLLINLESLHASFPNTWSTLIGYEALYQ